MKLYALLLVKDGENILIKKVTVFCEVFVCLGFIFVYLQNILISGDDSGKVVIWNFEPVRDEKAEKDENVPRVLCQMNNHLGK